MAGAKLFTAKVRREFLEHLRNTVNVTEAARRVGISRSRMYDLRRKDPLLAKGWDEALAATDDRLEAEAVRRAVDGVEEPYFYQGKECGSVRKYSDALMKFLLQKRLPGRYGDGSSLEFGAEQGQSRGAVVFEMHLGPEPGERGAPPDPTAPSDHDNSPDQAAPPDQDTGGQGHA